MKKFITCIYHCLFNCVFVPKFFFSSFKSKIFSRTIKLQYKNYLKIFLLRKNLQFITFLEYFLFPSKVIKSKNASISNTCIFGFIFSYITLTCLFACFFIFDCNEYMIIFFSLLCSKVNNVSMMYLNNTIDPIVYCIMLFLFITLNVILFVIVSIQQKFALFSHKILILIFLSVSFGIFFDFCLFFAQKNISLCFSYIMFILLVFFVSLYGFGVDYSKNNLLEIRLVKRYNLFLSFSTLYASRVFLDFLILNFEIHLRNSILPSYVYISLFFSISGCFCYFLYRQSLFPTFFFLLCTFTIIRVFVAFFSFLLNAYFLNETTISYVTKEQICCILFMAIVISFLTIFLCFALIGKLLMNFFLIYSKRLLDLKTYHFIILFLIYTLYTCISYASIDIVPEALSMFLFGITPEIKKGTSIICKRNLQNNCLLIDKQFNRTLFFKASFTGKQFLPDTIKAPGRHPLYSPVTVVPVTGNIVVTPMTHSHKVPGASVVPISSNSGFDVITDIVGDVRDQSMVKKRYIVDVRIFKKYWSPMDGNAIVYEAKHDAALKEAFADSIDTKEDLTTVKK